MALRSPVMDTPLPVGRTLPAQQSADRRSPRAKISLSMQFGLPKISQLPMREGVQYLQRSFQAQVQQITEAT